MPLTDAALSQNVRIAVYQRQEKVHEKCIFETPHNGIKCVLSMKESNFNEKMDRNFHFCLRSGPRGLTPYPLTPFPPYGHPDRKMSVFLDAFP